MSNNPGSDEIKVARTRRRTLKMLVGIAVLIVDIIVIVWVVPIAEERIQTDYGSGGYLVAFAMAFWTVMAFAVLVAAPKSGMSYPSEHLK